VRKLYSILLEDTGRTFNINMHTFDCFAVSKEEAVGLMFFERPEFRNREITKISCEGEWVYTKHGYAEMLDRALRENITLA